MMGDPHANWPAAIYIPASTSWTLDFSYAERIEGAGYMSPIHDIEIHYKAPLR